MKICKNNNHFGNINKRPIDTTPKKNTSFCSKNNQNGKFKIHNIKINADAIARYQINEYENLNKTPKKKEMAHNIKPKKIMEDFKKELLKMSKKNNS